MYKRIKTHAEVMLEKGVPAYPDASYEDSDLTRIHIIKDDGCLLFGVCKRVDVDSDVDIVEYTKFVPEELFLAMICPDFIASSIHLSTTQMEWGNE